MGETTVKKLTIVAITLLMMTLMPLTAAANYDGQKWLNYPYTLFGYDEFTWQTGFGGWVQDSCNTPDQQFKATLFKHKDYGKPKVRICDNLTAGTGQNSVGDTPFNHLCTVPMEATSNGYNAWECLIAGWVNAHVAQDKVSSIKLNSGFPPGKCLRVYRDGLWKGDNMKFGATTNHGKNIPNLHIFSINGQTMGDAISSYVKVNC